MSDVKITREMQEIKETALTVFEQAKKILIKDQAGYEQNAKGLRDIKTRWSDIEKKRKELVSPFMAGVKTLNEFFSVPLSSLKSAESIIKSALVAYVNEQEAKREKEEREAQARAEKEKERLEKKAERQEEKGQTLKAEETRIEAQFVPVPIIAPKVEAVKGVSFKKVWKYKITDPKKIPRQYLIIDTKTLSGLARSTQGKVTVPGVEFYAEKVAAGSKY